MLRKQDGRTDFDFVLGQWKIHSRRLRERLKGSTSWEEFEGTADTNKILGGLGNFGQVIFNRESRRVEGAVLRVYNPQSQQWSIYWADNVNGFSPIPVVGEFKNGCGEFYAQDLFEGRSILTRIIWSQITESSAHEEQAFSTDGGKTWETNWIMEWRKR